jgi:hypothetical protein
MDGAVAFVHPVLGKAGTLEVSVDIAGEHEGAVSQAVADVAQDFKPPMRLDAPVEVETVAVEPPGEFRIAAEGFGRGRFLEAQTGLGKRGIGAPEAFGAAKVRQAGIDAHARAGGDQEAIGRRDPFRRAKEGGGQIGGGANVNTPEASPARCRRGAGGSPGCARWPSSD